ncbi:type II secretion system protein GspD [Massilia suwonensis]|uniref:Type II secretion system protein GspD n=1 Tax=Massilia suwonensis TaxID=648895 RepID=A0ABW0MJK9_9BURK
MLKPIVLAALLAAAFDAAAAKQNTSQPATAVSSTASSTTAPSNSAPTSFVFRDTPIAELFEMISRHERVNIMLGKGVTGNVAVSLYDMTPRQAIYAIAEAGGYQVIARDNGYVIVNPAQPADAGTLPSGQLEVKALKVLYSEPQLVADILGKHVGRGGKVTVLPSRRMVVVEDTADGIRRIESLLREIDTQPQQIMIEAKILEITLDENENFGIEWNKVFSANGVNRIGTSGLVPANGAGLIFNYVNKNVDLYLNALSNKGRVRTLATPKLLTLENQEASTNIGDKLGYRVTTTINNVTSESIQFLETGVILRVTPSVDSDGRIALRVRPEVSSGSLLGGIPSKKTTEVNTQLVAENGQSILIGGLIKTSAGLRRTGVPILGEVPGLGKLFSNDETTGSSTETIVLITPRIVPTRAVGADAQVVERVQQAAGEIQQQLKGPAILP